MPDRQVDLDRWNQLVDSQHGVVGRRQAIDCGFSEDAIRERLERGAWQVLHRGVYAVHTGPISWPGLAQAALLRVGPGSCLSHLSAGYSHGLADDPGPIVHVSVPRDRRVTGRLRGIRVHRSDRSLSDAQLNRVPARTRIEATVLDLVESSLTVPQVIGWLTKACQRRLTTPGRLLVAAADRPRMRYRQVVVAVLADVAEGAQSPLELAHLRRVERAHGLPRGHRQTGLAGRRVTWIDVDYEQFGTRVELDGRLGHEVHEAFRDRARDNRSARAGVAALRYGFAEVLGDPCGVAAEQAEVLQARGWHGRPRPCGPRCPIG